MSVIVHPVMYQPYPPGARTMWAHNYTACDFRSSADQVDAGEHGP
jgi:hypothetical protein